MTSLKIMFICGIWLKVFCVLPNQLQVTYMAGHDVYDS